jgi:tryptophan halogenase
LPFPKDNAVDFHQLMTRHNVKLTDYLISAVAAAQGKFAHPPTENPASLLSRAEYGYYFNHTEVNDVLISKTNSSTIQLIEGTLAEVKVNDEGIDKLILDSGKTISADFYLDCSGVNGDLLSHLSQEKNIFREVNIKYVEQKNNTAATCRTVTPTSDGWQAITPLRDNTSILTVSSSGTESSTDSNDSFVKDSQGIHGNKVTFGHRPFAWLGNCVSVGHAACTIEPLSPAPMKLLSLDLIRLLELIPVDTNMALERQEYNRRFINDVTYADLFNNAFYNFRTNIHDTEKSIDSSLLGLSPFWQYGMQKSSLLERKITQFLHRGNLVSYDLEPFNQEDWAILHCGIGRLPDKYDRLVEIIDYNKMQEKLDKMKAELAYFVSRMPPHQLYITKLLQYLKDQA